MPTLHAVLPSFTLLMNMHDVLSDTAVNHAHNVHDAHTVLFVSPGCFITLEGSDYDVAKPSWKNI